jgi:hypothetical protein
MIEDGLVIFSKQQEWWLLCCWIERAPRAAAAVCSDHSSIHTSPVTTPPHDRVFNILKNRNPKFGLLTVGKGRLLHHTGVVCQASKPTNAYKIQRSIRTGLDGSEIYICPIGGLL